VSLEELGIKSGNKRATVLGESLSAATGRLLDARKSPSRKCNELDNRGSSFYIAMYWAEEMAKHDASFNQLAKSLKDNEAQIVKDMIDCQGTYASQACCARESCPCATPSPRLSSHAQPSRAQPSQAKPSVSALTATDFCLLLCTRRQASPPTSAATTSLTPPRWTPSCAPAPSSTSCWTSKQER
jgi:hypothetical protein